jgi:hypothetical protein
MLSAKTDELAQVAVASPVELTLHFFVVDPDNVRGNDLHARSLHLEELFFPVLVWVAGEVELTHYG